MKPGFLAVSLTVVSTASLLAQTAAPVRRGPIVSPELHPDRTVTFRLRAPNATNVVFAGESLPRTPMTADEHGVWTATIGPVDPGVYAYGFTIDGFRLLDPANPLVKPEPVPLTSMFAVPAQPPAIFDFDPAIPHGTVRLHDYESKSLGKLRRLRVYAPPGYDAGGKYPVLFLLHGSGDTEATWTEFGRAHFILDHLLAAKKIKPMLVVMPNGFAARANADPAADNRGAALSAFESDLLQDALPFIEKNYRVKSGRENRGIVGLSMGGGQALTIGLNHLDQFAWIGGMSSSVPNPEPALAAVVADPAAANKKLKLLWFSCGRADTLLKANEQFDEALTQHGVKHTFNIAKGGHEWTVWRNNLEEFLPLVFSEKK